MTKAQKEWYLKNRERLKKYKLNWKRQNYKREWEIIKNNPVKISKKRERNRKYTDNHPEKQKYKPKYKEIYQLSIKKWREKYPERVVAHKMVKIAIRNGTMKRLSCEVCGKLKTHAHHPDYLKPLNVVFLCPTHHKQIHGRK